MFFRMKLEAVSSSHVWHASQDIYKGLTIVFVYSFSNCSSLGVLSKNQHSNDFLSLLEDVSLVSMPLIQK